MSKRTSSLAILVCAAASLAFGQSSFVFQVPGVNGYTAQIFGQGDNDFQRHLGPKDVGVPGAYRVLALPDGSAFYVITPTAVLSAVPSGQNLANLTTLSGITGNIIGSGLTPDGKYLVILADRFYIVTTATNAVLAADQAIPFGGTPVDFAVSPDSQTIWVLASLNNDSQGSLAAISPSTAQSSGVLSLPYPVTSLTLSPLGLLYVVYNADKVDEINPVTLTVTPSGHMNLPGGQVSGRLHFTPDGSAAYSSSRSACAFNTCFTVFQLNVASHSFTGAPLDVNSPAPFFDDILVAGNNRIFGFSSSAGPTVAKLWDITPSPLSTAPTSLSLGIALSAIQSVVISDERPTPRYLFILDSDLNRPLLRVGLSDNTVGYSPAYVGQALSFASIPAQAGSAATFVTLNTTQTVSAGAASAPLIAHATDSLGRPVFNQQVCFSTDPSTGVSIANPSQHTNSNGAVQTYVTAPSAQGTYNVTLGFGPCGSTSTFSTFTINVGTVGSGSPTSSQISIYTGNGQLLRQNTSASQPLTVKIVNPDGTPIAGALVTFSITGGPGTFSDSTSYAASFTATADEDGFASTGFTGGAVTQGLSFQATTVTATSDYGSVDFIETTHNALVQDPQGIPRVTPVNYVTTFEIAQGQVLPALFTARTISQKPPQGVVPIPKVGIRLADPVSASYAPSSVVACQGSSLGDDQGISRCDAVGICQPAGTSFPLTANVNASVGEYGSYPMQVTLTQGTASKIKITSTDFQTGSPGKPFTLVGLITDGCGQPVGNVPVTWSFYAGSNPTGSSLSSASTFSSSGGSVSVQVTLGNTPGPVLVQLSAGSVATAIFHLTNQVAVTSITPVAPLPASVGANSSFSALTFEVRNANGNLVSGISVNFALSGSASAGATVNASATTNNQGQVQATVVAGPNTGSIVVTATYATLTGTATLTVALPGPQVNISSFTNAASGTIGMTPCGLVTVRGSGLAAGVQGVLSGVNLFGPPPASLAGVSIAIQQDTNVFQVWIREVANDQSGQRVTFQAPCGLTATSPVQAGIATVTVTVGGASVSVFNVPVFAAKPGLFTFTGSNSKQYGVVIREADGTYVTPEHQAHRGDKLYLLVTGLGQTTPALTTNSTGLGTQNANVPMLVFLNDTALNTISARYLFGSIGAYLVEFQIPADFPLGTDLNILPVATANNGNDFIVGNTSLLAGVTQ